VQWEVGVTKRSGAWTTIRTSLGMGIRDEKLGTFLGVFTPSVLTILGVILYLRTGWVVGNVGLIGALWIVVIANLVTLVTALSVSAIATNMRVGTGGAYYMISRSLGIEVGTAIGIPLFGAMAFSITLYAFGLAESAKAVWPDAPQRPIAALTILVVAVLAARGAGIALRLQLPIMLGVGLSMVALVYGVATSDISTAGLTETVGNPEPFWAVFAVFFPAVTGILAGISLSGDLKRPHRSIPLGSIAAVLTGFAVYLLVPVLLAVSSAPDELANNSLIWFDLAGPLSFLVLWGLWGAIFSSAVGSVLGAPRTLQAMVDDRVLPRGLGRKFAAVRGPGVPLLVTFALALGAVALGDMDSVAPVLTMFFLASYGTINLVAGIEQLSGDPSFRPRLHVPWWLSIAGAFACFSIMFLINPVALAAALLIEFGVYVLIRRRALPAPWGDLRRGALMSLIRRTVVQLRQLPHDPRNWRPNILLFAGDVARRSQLVRIASALVADRGILTVSKLVVGKVDELSDSVGSERQKLADDLESLGVLAFPEVDIVPTYEDGAITVAQSNGIAGIESNTVMIGWTDKSERQPMILRVVSSLARLGMSAIICIPDEREWRRRSRVIHVWWGGLQQNGDLLILFAHLLSLSPEWRGAEIVVNSIATNDMTMERNERLLRKLIGASRIDATPQVILKPQGVKVQDIIRKRSAHADIVLLGLRGTEPGEESKYATRIAEMADGLPTVIFVRSAGEFRGQLLGDVEEIEPAKPEALTDQ
jgi:potassium/chloride transporter 4/5/6